MDLLGGLFDCGLLLRLGLLDLLRGLLDLLGGLFDCGLPGLADCLLLDEYGVCV